MALSKYLTAFAGTAAVALFSGAAFAADMGSLKDEAPATEERQFTYSFNIGLLSDYTFRGISQNAEDPTVFGGADIGYGIFYAGIWMAGLDFDAGLTTKPFFLGEDAELEIDLYAGIKPVWGPATFDFAVIGYLYPNASDRAGELDYVEFKAGVSGEVYKGLTATGVVYYSPEYTGELGSTYVPELTLAYALPAVGVFSPSISGQVGAVFGEDQIFENSFGDDHYVYWNAGLSVAVEKLTFDFRYWDTDLGTSAPLLNNNTTAEFNSDERFVASVKVTLP